MKESPILSSTCLKYIFFHFTVLPKAKSQNLGFRYVPDPGSLLTYKTINHMARAAFFSKARLNLVKKLCWSVYPGLYEVGNKQLVFG